MSAAVEAIWPPGLDTPPYGEDDEEVRHAFEALTLDEARSLEDRATQVLETRVSHRPYDDAEHARIAARELLVRLVGHVRGALIDVHMRLIEVDVMGSIKWVGFPHLLFHDGGPDVVERLLALDPDDGLPALAWMAGDTARQAPFWSRGCGTAATVYQQT